ncbi:ABC transporter permease [Ornithinimicrobium tianjinense]|uniref:Transport permease protein n=1 Tax=Ornithinimicrobium tianjinense TaxID=1195761 RepID=A0A917BQN2_9MICO|nr:ABC transporter permease [Ornithinimicrobium tianjinense]GGF52798.1 transport permease protein [Ornithinimicrobium tianjinense]
MTELGPDPLRLPDALSDAAAEALARRHGLQQASVRPGLVGYARELWSYRGLMWALARGEFVTAHRDNYLGLLWSVLTPLLLGASYYLVFGLLLGTSRGIEHFITFLTSGLFTYSLFAVSLTSGSKALLNKRGMMRSLQFPRVMLPIVTVLAAFVGQLPAFGVLLVLAFWEQGWTLPWTVLLLPVALLIVTTMGLGLAMLTSRLVHAVRDLANLMPLVVRLLRYVSGVFFSVELQLERIGDAPAWVAATLTYQPAAVSLTMVRETVMTTEELDPTTWLVSVGWAVLFLVVGFVVFWRGEGSYGRA